MLTGGGRDSPQKPGTAVASGVLGRLRRSTSCVSPGHRHSKPFRVQPPHLGRFSSHFFRRCRPGVLLTLLTCIARRGLTFATSTSRSQPCTRSLQMDRNKLVIQVQHRNSESSAINPGGNSNNGGQGRNGEEEKLTISGRFDTLLRQATLTRVPVAGPVAQCFIMIVPNGWKTNRQPLRGSRKLLVCFRGLTRGL